MGKVKKLQKKVEKYKTRVEKYEKKVEAGAADSKKGEKLLYKAITKQNDYEERLRQAILDRQAAVERRRRRQQGMDKSSDSDSSSYSEHSDHSSDDGAANAQRELETSQEEVGSRKEVWFTDGSRATVHLHHRRTGNFYWTWRTHQHPNGYYPLVPPPHGERGFRLVLGEGTRLTLDREKTNHQAMVDVGAYVKGSGAVEKNGFDGTDMLSAQFSQFDIQ